jgi:tetratricopeptide (TPR) repeat protein
MKAIVGVVLGAVVALTATAPAAERERFGRDEWVAIVRVYARGDRAAALGALGAWSEHDLVRQVTGVEQLARAAERCPACPSALDGVPLEAAVMLLWDRDRADHGPRPGVEQEYGCPGPLARLAGRLAWVVARRAASAAFARSFLRAVVLQCQWDACFDGAERWAGEAIEIYPRDAELLLDRGSVREELATLGSTPRPWEAQGSPGGPQQTEAAARRESLGKARRDFEDALAVDPALALARVRLARVLWRLGEPAQALEELDAALPALTRPEHLYLAHLFLGRLHQDAGRLEQATAEYRHAVALRPSALSAAVALSEAELVAGDAAGAREALRQGLVSAGQRRERDPYWDYLVTNAADLTQRFAELRRQTLE